MLFNSIDYVVFLALALVAYWALARLVSPRLIFLFVASCAFYMAWQPFYIALILGSTVLDFYVGLRIARAKSAKTKKRWLLVSIAGNLGLLGTFKYFNFFSEAVGSALGLAGIAIDPPFLDVLLPVGISFYTFQTLSYTIDVYRGRIEATASFVKFAVFVTYFPQLVAGPIVRATELLPQLDRDPVLDRERVGTGLFLIATGLTKKVAIADLLSVNIVDRVFANPSLFTAPEVVVALYAFTVQIYCDFSGYTDVARGSAMLMGLELPENFDRPYQATSPAEFWRRWHMTLSTWLRDYLYFPLGGSRVSRGRSYANLWITIFLIGIWHGASWTFVLYGILQASAMVLHRVFRQLSGRPRDAVDPWPTRALKVFLCLQFVVFSRILFRATGIENAWDVTARLFSGTTSLAQVSTSVWLILVLAMGAHYLPKRVYASAQRWFVALPPLGQGVALAALAGGLALVATTDVVPFIYYQF
jgi:D-alanyl-lipoteichoic acid acyltransferase DltB (MBOAT superfamily)